MTQVTKKLTILPPGARLRVRVPVRGPGGPDDGADDDLCRDLRGQDLVAADDGERDGDHGRALLRRGQGQRQPLRRAAHELHRGEEHIQVRSQLYDITFVLMIYRAPLIGGPQVW